MPHDGARRCRARPARSRDRPRHTESIARAVGYVRTGEAAAVVTNPIAKKTLYDAGFKHPGHTEYLGELAGGLGRAGACR